MENCIFCKIVKKEAPFFRVYEDENTMAFLDIFPSAPGHTVVIIKRHGLSILDYDEKSLGKLMGTVKVIAKKIQKVFTTDSITIGINHLEERGVPHLHVHLIPRWDADEGGIIQSVVHNIPKEDKKVIADKLRKA